MSLISQGLTISLAGLALTFAALGLLILIIVVLEKLLPAPSGPGELALPADGTEPTSPSDLDSDTAAAIAVAMLALAGSEKAGSISLGSALTAGRGRWWNPMDNVDRPGFRERRFE